MWVRAEGRCVARSGVDRTGAAGLDGLGGLDGDGDGDGEGDGAAIGGRGVVVGGMVEGVADVGVTSVEVVVLSGAG
jgi:hypothetical protein